MVRAIKLSEDSSSAEMLSEDSSSAEKSSEDSSSASSVSKHNADQPVVPSGEILRTICLRSAAAFMLALQIGVFIFCLVVPYHDWFLRFARYNGWDATQEWVELYFQKAVAGGWARQIGALLAFSIFAIFRKLTKKLLSRKEKDKVTFLQEVSRYMALNWVSNFMQSMNWTVVFYIPCQGKPLYWVPMEALQRLPAASFFKLAVDLLACSTDTYFYGLVQRRLQLVEEGLGRQLGSKTVKVVRYAGALVLPMLFFIYGEIAAHSPVHNNAATQGWYWAITNFAQGIAPCVVAAILFLALSKVLTLTRIPVPGLKGYALAEKLWAEETVKSLRRSMVLPLAVNGAMYIVKGTLNLYEKTFSYSLVTDAVACIMVQLMEASCLAFLVGVFKETKPELGLKTGEVQEEEKHRRSRSHLWQDKVESLAERGISAFQLLHFFQMLGKDGSVMPHFDPRKSTTNDVVRQAIIPLSQSGNEGLSYAELIRPSSAAMPGRMVTHNWGNLFSMLLAAVIADALGEEDYVDTAQQLLDGRVKELEKRLQTLVEGERLYWICAFCVNQHRGICGGFGKPPTNPKDYKSWDAGRRDSVTGQVFQTCSCATPKHFSDHPEECEMNKFDDMMRLLKNKVGLKQIVAVDRSIRLFRRAWCVAELVEARASRIPQQIQIYSRKEFEVGGDSMLYKKLAFLSVADCEASNPMDKEEILAKIPDKEAFDVQLQAIIFGMNGLFQQNFVGFGILDAAVRTAHRIKCLTEAEDLENGA